MIPPIIREARILSFGNTKVAIIHDAGAISKIRIYARCNINGNFFSVCSSKTNRYPPKRLENIFLKT